MGRFVPMPLSLLHEIGKLEYHHSPVDGVIDQPKRPTAKFKIELPVFAPLQVIKGLNEERTDRVSLSKKHLCNNGSREDDLPAIGRVRRIPA